MKTVTVNAEALHRVLSALNGTGYMIRELQFTRGPLVGADNPINILVAEFNAAVEAAAKPKEEPGCARLESEAQIIDGHLVIKLSITTLAHAARNSDYFFNAAEQGTPLAITDESEFAASVVGALNIEDEDGSTPISRMLDAATEHVAEQGEPGIEEGGAL